MRVICNEKRGVAAENTALKRSDHVGTGDMMIDDIAESAAKGIFRIILEFLFRIIVEIVLFYTGEILLFVMTLGRKKPRWDYYAMEKPSKSVIFTEISVWFGLAFWLFVAWFANSVLLH